MRAALSLIAGTPGRLTVTSVALTALAMVLFGHAPELAIIAIGGLVFGMGFAACFVVLGAFAAAAGVFEAGEEESVNEDS